MAILRPFIIPTAGQPVPVVAPPQRRYRMNQPEFYNQQAQKKALQESGPAEMTQLVTPDTRVQPPQFTNEPLTQQSVQDQFQRLQQRPALPELHPAARVKSANAELVSPSSFQAYYDQLDQIGSLDSARTQTEQAKSAFRRMQEMQSLMASGIPPAFGGVGGEGGFLDDAPGDKRLAPHVRGARQEIINRFGITNIGGHATSGHIKGSDHYTGHALDVMGGKQNVADWAVQNAAALGVKYVIYNGRIFDVRNGKGWTKYTGSNPHTGHVHISFMPTKPSGPVGGGLPMGVNTPANFKFAQAIAPKYGWTGAELSAWYTLGMKESGWRHTAQNPHSTAYGIGQFLDKTWASYGIPKTSDPRLQVEAMARYIKARYGSPSRALAFHKRNNWY